jgi:phospho-N-acetylmuramoyl-pentapeptide-transferase
MFNSRIFAAGSALVLSFIFGIILFPPFIKYLRKKDFNSELEKGKTPPVQPAGFLFVFVILIVSLITARFNTIVIFTLSVYVLYAIIGFVDDVVKIKSKKKIACGKLEKKSYLYKSDGISAPLRLCLYLIIAFVVSIFIYKFIPDINKDITIPFISKTNVNLSFWEFVFIATFTIAIVANGVNFTDGLDTLAIIPLITNFVFVAIVAYIVSRSDWSKYLLVPFSNNIAIVEVVPVISAAVGVLFAYLWFNSPPSSIIMGDSGSIGLGGFLGVLFVLLKVEFFIPIIAFVFIVEFMSSFFQMAYFKITKGKRFFKCAPIHHHFQFLMREKKIFDKKDDIRAELKDCDNLSDETLKRIARKLQNKEIDSKITWGFHITSFILLVFTVVLYMKVR